MKWLFLLLLIINVGIFTWGYQHEQLMQEPAIDAGADVGNMRLISELAEGERREITQDGDETDAEVVIAKVEQPKAEHMTAIKEEAEQTETTETEKVPEKEEKAKPKDVSKEGPEQETKNETGVKRQEPVEQHSVSPDKTAVQSEKKKQEKDKSGIVSRCGVIGPLKDHQVAKDVVEELKKSELETKLERKIEKEQIGYWVVIPPMEDGGQAQAKIDELTQAGVKDIWHFRGGGMKDAISLGMFAQKGNAVNFSKEVSQKGFKTEMRPRYLNKTRYLVTFTITKPKNVAENLWQDVEKKYSKMPFSEQSCE